MALAKEALAVGFGWSFYGFFIAASVWMVLYFVWAFAVAEPKDRQRR